MEDDLNVFEKEDDFIFSKLKTTSFFQNWRRPQKIMQLKAIKCKNNTILENGRQPQFI